jgi:hypothetical protein
MIFLAKIFGMELFHADLWELFFKFGIDLFVIFILIRMIYFPIHRKKDHLFTYFVFNVLIFFLCILLNSVKLSIGFAFGLFAIFGILRYRTEQIPMKEMTYLFTAISLAVINALVSKRVSVAELVFTNSMILLTILALERLWLTRYEANQTIIYEKINLVKPENRELLKADLEERLGLKVARIEVGRINLLRDTAMLRVYYFEGDQSASSIAHDAGSTNID